MYYKLVFAITVQNGTGIIPYLKTKDSDRLTFNRRDT